MSPTTGPYSTTGETEATTGPYAGTAADQEAIDPAMFIAMQAKRISDLSGLLRGMARRVRVARHHIRESAVSWNSAVGVLLDENDRLRAALTAAATPAPPVDVAAPLDVLTALIGDMACGLEVGDNTDAELADYLIRLRAIARALTGEATS